MVEAARLGVQVIEEAEGKKKRMRYGKKSGEIIVS